MVIRWFDHARDVATAATLPDGPFRGVPFLLKDLSAHYAGQPLTNGNARCAGAADLAADTTLVSTLPSCRARHARPYEQPRAGERARDRAGRLRPDAQPVEHRARPGRIEWRSGGRRRVRDGADRPRLRRRRFDPHPGVVLRAGGLKPSQGRITLGPFRTESGLSVELCVSRTVRDTARLLDAVQVPASATP